MTDDAWLYFEIMDRTHILCSQISNSLEDHPALDAEHAEMVDKATEILAEVYQWAGRKLEEATKDD